ncbi:MAG: division/cell wall cluster transcriptional repressor MraZ [Gammaproteobacteria bacterium]|jgi:MraZ protein|nr:division/cell wall cluster transcriptional repressor MraZ [Gammaproteobacteria bacterium]MBT7307776.1 division/cell wall cluster transcriptional repressor MraZ [Gammaproteobacteria bacterium]
MFRGNKTVKLDGKGRLSIPTHYRTQLLEAYGGKVVVAPDIHSPCLNLYPLPEWELMEEKIAQLPGRQQSTLRRFVIGRSQECEMDGTGRILLSQELRDYANLDKGAILAGVGFKMELWDEAAWREVSQPEELSEDDLNQLQDVYF